MQNTIYISLSDNEGGSRLVWDTCVQQLVEPNVDKRERAMGFYEYQHIHTIWGFSIDMEQGSNHGSHIKEQKKCIDMNI